jgi:hypothetical protein
MKTLTINQLRRVQKSLLLFIVIGPLLLNSIFHYPTLTVWFQVFVLVIGSAYVFYQLKMQGQEGEMKNRLIRTMCLLLLTFIGITTFNKFYAKPKVDVILNRSK